MVFLNSQISIKHTLPRGTKDILPEEIKLWQKIEAFARGVFSNYLYEEIRTPIFEHTDLFERGLGNETDIVEKEMYSFEDKGKRKLTLRPEGTASVVRAALEHHLLSSTQPRRLYYLGPMFRYERPQAGRYMQFHQIGVEHLGSSSPFADAEVISMGIRLFDLLGLKGLSVSLNSVGCNLCRPVIEEKLKQFISSFLHHLCENCKRRFQEKPLRILDCKNLQCTTYFSGLPDIRKAQCRGCKDHFSAVIEYMDTMGIAFNVNNQLVRGLDYYSRTAFEIHSNYLGAQNAICGGGRYDGLVQQMGGPFTPSIGFAFGVERVALVLKELKQTSTEKKFLVSFIGMGIQHKTTCFKWIDQLRQLGVACDMDFEKDDLKIQLKRALNLNANYAVLYGDLESEKGIIVIKDLKLRKQEEVAKQDLISYIQKRHATDTCN
jgi:histidyl-tRNA synthetase